VADPFFNQQSDRGHHIVSAGHDWFVKGQPSVKGAVAMMTEV